MLAPQVVELFGYIDTDGDGHISRREFVAGFGVQLEHTSVISLKWSVGTGAWRRQLFNAVPPLLIKSMYPRKTNCEPCQMYMNSPGLSVRT